MNTMGDGLYEEGGEAHKTGVDQKCEVSVVLSALFVCYRIYLHSFYKLVLGKTKSKEHQRIQRIQGLWHN